ncbi:MAG: class I SAM-dependent methyltransferase [Pseudomonadota bacterium]
MHIFPLPAKEEIKAYYEYDYSIQYLNEKNDRLRYQLKRYFLYKIKHRFAALRFDSQMKFISFHLKHHAARRYKNMLDIGCGTGATLHYFNKKGWQVEGLEFNPYFAQKIRDTLMNENIIESDIESHDFGDKKFDLIVMSHVFEHLARPIEVLKKIKELLVRDGFIFIEIPNSAHELFKHPDYDDIEHTFFYSYDTLKKILQISGFRVIDIESVDPLELAIGRHFYSAILYFKKGKIIKMMIPTLHFIFSAFSLFKLIFLKRNTSIIKKDTTGSCLRAIAVLGENK